MKATIRVNGTLEIKSETEQDSYSLNKWIEDNSKYEMPNLRIILNPGNIKI